MFKKIDGKIVPKDEESILKFWQESNIFRKSVESRKDGRPYIFYEGPPTANGEPHIGHLMPRLMKDVFPRYKTMTGHLVERKGGWDTHGLPVELEVEKELGLKNKNGIEEYGVEKFIKKCKESVFRYKTAWEQMLDRFAFWIDLDDPYITYEDDYIESLWWVFKQAWDKDMLYEGHKIVPYCPRCGTALSSHEVSQGYEEVQDPSVYVKMKLRDEDASFLVWTTTPWTLPSNVALAVGVDFDYVMVEEKGERMIMAKELLGSVLSEDHKVVREMKGSDLLDVKYHPLFDTYKGDKVGFYVVGGDFVSLEDGSGIVHLAPAFGEDDYNLGREHDLPFVQPVDLEGKFTQEVQPFTGQFVKDADPGIIKHLEEKGSLYKSGLYEHDYPFCWRCSTALLYYARHSWYIRTTAVKEKVLKNNGQISWYPSHMQEGRFGDFLDNLVDWAISRERYWGTPLNIWVCEECDEKVCVGGRDELVEKALDKDLAAKVEFHKPYIDQVKLRCAKCQGTMNRVSAVADCWYDSGCMHTAQWHYPFENQDKFKAGFPADFISEAQDQTRGWFYTLLVTSTFLYDQPAFKNVVVTGIGLDKEGQKMSKSRGNVIDPWDMVAEHGVDAVRWYICSATSPWNSRRFYHEAMNEVMNKFLGTLKNIYSFFVLYANIDGYDPREHVPSHDSIPLIDRWILSRYHNLIRTMRRSLDDYDITLACRAAEDFVEELSNWYVRSCRDRFWSFDLNKDKVRAYNTLNTVLLGTAKLTAPFIPFLSEDIYRNLVVPLYPDAAESVHLCDYPDVDEAMIDSELEAQMDTLREIVVAARAARNQAKIKVRQPLSEMIIIGGEDDTDLLKDEEFVHLIRSELNVKEVKAAVDLKSYLRPSIKIDFGKLGPKYGKLVNRIRDEVAKMDAVEGFGELEREGKITLELEGEEVELLEDELTIEHTEEAEGFSIAEGGGFSVVLSTYLDDDLRSEGYIRELVNKIQFMRKNAGYEVMDRIEVFYQTTDEVKQAIDKHKDYLMQDTLAVSFLEEKPPAGNGVDSQPWDINGHSTILGVRKVEEIE